MARKAPGSSARADAALDAVLARAPAPALPPGLAARIIANATALPQLPADPVPEPEVVRAEEQRKSAELIVFPTQVAEKAEEPPRRRIFVVGGFAALAAGIAAAVVLGQTGQGVLAPTSAPAAMVAQQQPAQQAAPPAIIAAPPVERLAAAAPAAPVTAPSKAGKIQQHAPTAPQAPVAAPVETQLATSGQRPASGTAAGPLVDPSPAPRVIPNGGLMGPPAPQQGWGFSGGIPGSGTLPGGQSLPSQTTGSMPPPPPPGAGPAHGPGGHR
ncbi:hypothetical protein OVA07_03795 [Novosphingobium sp. SL115]|uniref:hypothetical protein n=1 Tax=Novosphingobium sp. SL115 TaxID=2995150 RepID=UPI0022769FAD|nr:hypothetical protein [Novosphingobium sp. SL115]MCY1670130.1 hypothetical protein [Novosphingobium sp. SL115]